MTRGAYKIVTFNVKINCVNVKIKLDIIRNVCYPVFDDEENEKTSSPNVSNAEFTLCSLTSDCRMHKALRSWRLLNERKHQ
jgi:hypothetical protein